MNKLMHIKIKYITITIGLLGLIPYGFPLIQNYEFINYYEIKTINFTIWYGITILCFLSGVYWGLSINTLTKNYSNLNYLLPALSVIPFIFAIGALIASSFINIIFLVTGFLICQILDEISFAHKLYFSWYIVLRRFLTVVVVTLLIYYYIIYTDV